MSSLNHAPQRSAPKSFKEFQAAMKLKMEELALKIQQAEQYEVVEDCLSFRENTVAAAEAAVSRRKEALLEQLNAVERSRRLAEEEMGGLSSEVAKYEETKQKVTAELRSIVLQKQSIDLEEQRVQSLRKEAKASLAKVQLREQSLLKREAKLLARFPPRVLPLLDKKAELERKEQDLISSRDVLKEQVQMAEQHLADVKAEVAAAKQAKEDLAKKRERRDFESRLLNVETKAWVARLEKRDAGLKAQEASMEGRIKEVNKMCTVVLKGYLAAKKGLRPTENIDLDMRDAFLDIIPPEQRAELQAGSEKKEQCKRARSETPGEENAGEDSRGGARAAKAVRTVQNAMPGGSGKRSFKSCSPNSSLDANILSALQDEDESEADRAKKGRFDD